MLSPPRQWHMLNRLAMETRFHFVRKRQTHETSCRFPGLSRPAPRPAPAGSVPITSATHYN